MAHFAKLDSDNRVIHVSVVDNWNCVDGEGNEVEAVGVAYLKSIHGADTNWKQTSYNGNIRKNYAGIGMTYDAGRDAFIPVKPYTSWVLNETTCQWEAPTPMPTDAGEDEYYRWDEDTTEWVLETRPV
jgi:hypothetical protein